MDPTPQPDADRPTPPNEQSLLEKLEETNRKLLQAETYKSYFLSNIRNEINNPMASVLSAATHLQAVEDLETAHQLAALVYNESRNLNFQLENLFMAAELEAGV